MRPLVAKLHARAVRVMGHPYFFIGVLIFFVLNALWIALSSSYPMIFDEDYHVGIIDIYSRQLSPFIAVQPPEASFYGDITRLTSYFFHYLMSFPYRLTGLFTDDLTTKIIVLRMINIAFVTAGLLLWRNVLDRLSLSRAASHIVILFFTLVPLVPYIAAQSNYDNLIFLLLPCLILVTLNAMKSRAHQLVWILTAAGLSAFMILIKFTMLPVVAAVVVALSIWLVRTYGRHLLSGIKNQFSAARRPLLIGSILFAALGIGLFAERYVGNIVSYGDFQPSCETVQSAEVCRNYSVWVRNDDAKQRAQFVDKSTLWNPLAFSTNRWIPHIFNDLFVTASFVYIEPELHRFVPSGMQTSPGGFVFRMLGWTVLAISLFLTIVYWRQLPARHVRHLLVFILLTYAAALWITNYTGYRELGIAYATQGRYMVPFIIPMLGIGVLALNKFLKRAPYLKSITVLVALLIALQSAGALTYILHSNAGWQWDVGYFREWNYDLRHALNSFLRW